MRRGRIEAKAPRLMIAPRALVVVSVLMSSRIAAAQAHSAATSDARRLFQDGLEKVQQGDLHSALRAFQNAYAAQRHFSVLYNIGQAQTMLGHPAEAIAAFDAYLVQGAKQVPAARRQEVLGLIESNRARIGYLQLRANAARDARVWLDGKDVSDSVNGSPISLVTGPHSLIHSQGDRAPGTTELDITAGKVTEIELPAPPPSSDAAPALTSVATIAVECPIPDAAVEVVGVARAKTPLFAPLLVPARPLELRFSRPGYDAVTRSVSPASGKTARVQCGLRVSRDLSPLLSGHLKVQTSPGDAAVRIDGEPLSDAPLPPGAHHVAISRSGFLPRERTIVIQPAQTLLVEERLVPDERTQAAAAAHRQRTMSLILGGVGAVCLGVGAGLLRWNSGRFQTWRAERPGESESHNVERATSIQRVDDIGVGALIVGGGLALSGGVLFIDSLNAARGN